MLHERLQADMKAAMRQRDEHGKQKLSTIRMLISEVKRAEIDQQKTLTDTDILAITQKMIKQRQDAAKQYTQGNRPELAAQETLEIDILKAYLPEPLGDNEIDQLIQTAITDTGATSMRDMGAVMAQLKPQLQGRADMSVVSAKIKQTLAGAK